MHDQVNYSNYLSGRIKNAFICEPPKPESAQSIGETVLCVIGKDPETANHYIR